MHTLSAQASTQNEQCYIVYTSERRKATTLPGPVLSMDSEEEGPNDEEGEEDDGNQFLVGFMFGNVGTDMRLEEDYLDEASPSVHLCSQSASVVPTART